MKLVDFGIVAVLVKDIKGIEKCKDDVILHAVGLPPIKLSIGYYQATSIWRDALAESNKDVGGDAYH